LQSLARKGRLSKEQAAVTHRPQGADPQPPPFLYAREGKRGNYPSGIGEWFSQTISNLWHAALLRRCELPLETKVLIQYSELQPHPLPHKMPRTHQMVQRAQPETAYIKMSLILRRTRLGMSSLLRLFTRENEVWKWGLLDKERMENYFWLCWLVQCLRCDEVDVPSHCCGKCCWGGVQLLC
jgi:hypothetical protein